MSTRHPLAQAPLITGAMAGAAYVCGVTPPTSVEALLPMWLVTCWYWLTLIRCVLTEVGAWWRTILIGLVIERVGLFYLAGGAGVYGIAVGSRGTWNALLAGG